jgi:hypothetical protein
MKHFHLIVFIALMSMVAYAQVPNYQWAKSADGFKDDEGRAISTDANGNVYITGGFQSPTITFGTTTLTLTGVYGSNIFIAKYDVSGNMLWAKNIGGTGLGAYGWSISNDTNGNVYLTGFFKDPTITFGNIAVNNTGFNNNNIFIAKYDPNGNVLWAKNVGSMYLNCLGVGISNDASGNVFITGWYDYEITIGSTTLTNAGGFSGTTDIFIAKYDANGNELWAKSAGGNASDAARGIATDASGNVYITGDFSSQTFTIGTNTLTNTLGSGGDVFIAKYDPNGNVLWAKKTSSTGGDEGRGISTDTSGNVFITGTFSGPTMTLGSDTLKNAGYNNIFIAKYNSNGNVLWAKSEGGTNNDYGLGIATDKFGNAFITGEFYSPTMAIGTNTLNNNSSAGGRDIFVAKYDANGNVVWADSKGGIYVESGYGIATDASGDAYITGSYQELSISFGNTTLLNNSDYFDIYVAKISQPTAIEQQQKETSFSIAPNPFSSQTTITFNVEQVNSSMKIMDIIGKEIKTQLFSGKQLIIEKGDMNVGIYFIQIIDNENRMMTKKIIVQ